MTKFQNSELGKSHELYKDLLLNFKSGKSAEYHPSEKKFCENEFIRCCRELSKWDFLDPVSLSMDLSTINVFSKWNIEESGFLTLNSMRKISEDYNNCSFKDKCLETWKCLPKFFNRQHYSLLGLTQEITELTEAWDLLKQLTAFSNNSQLLKEKMVEICNRIRDAYYKWQERSYLISDDYQFLTEIFHIRLAFLNFFHTEYSSKIKDHQLDVVTRTDFENIAIFTKHEMNESLIELCSTALNCRNLHVKNLQLDRYSSRNLSSLLQFRLSSLLHDVGPSSNLEAVNTEKITERVDLITAYNNLYMCNRTEIPKLDVNVLNIFQEFGFDIKSSMSYLLKHQIKIAELYESLCVQVEKDFNPGQCMDIVAALMRGSLYFCMYGDIEDSIKILPKVLHMLEFEDKDCVLPKVLQDFKVPSQYWLPFLPFLVTRLLHALNAEEENSEMEIDGETKPSLSSVLSNLLMDIGADFPQDVFLSLYSFKEMDRSCEKAEFIDIQGEGVCILCTDLVKEKCKEIITSLEKKYPSLVSHLEELMKDFKTLSPAIAEIDQCALKRLLEEVYSSFYKNFSTGNVSNCPEEIISDIKKSLKVFFDNPDIKEDKEISDVISSLDKDTCSFDSVFTALQRLLEKYSYLLNVKCTKRSFYLTKSCPFVSNFNGFGEDINVFGLSPIMGSCSPVKIKMFLPKVEVQMWGDHLSYKINILGQNGKVYSFLIKEDLHKMKSLRRLTCIQMLENMNALFKNNVEYAKRFFNMSFPRITSISPHLILMPYHHKVLLYQDILTYKDEVLGYSPHLEFTSCLLKNPEAFQNFEKIASLFKKVRNQTSKVLLTSWVKNSYEDPTNRYLFKKEFIKHISQLIASELFLNISMKNELLVFKKSGVVSAGNPELNLKNIQNISLLLTPNICEFIGPLGLKLVAEKIYWIATCFKQNSQLISSYLHLLIKDYSDDKDVTLQLSPKSIVKKLDNVKREYIEKSIKLSTSTDAVFQVSPLMQPFY